MGLRSAFHGTRAAVPKYTREVIASMRECGRRHIVEDAASGLAGLTGQSIGAFWIGHATVLLRMGGLNILTDPVFSRRIGMRVGGVTIGMARVCPPAADVGHLPPIDVVMLSHAHFDHLDRPSLKRLAAGPARGATVVTAQNTRKLVPPGFGEVLELPWRQSLRLGRGAELMVHAMQPEHWGARTAVDRHRRFNSYLLESADGRVLFAGDTAHTHAFDVLGPVGVDLAVFGIGAYDPWEHAHATPEQVWNMYTRLSGGTPRGVLLPMHHSTFVLGREPLHEPIARLRGAAGAHASHIVAAMPGEVWLGNAKR
jgi:L-ascorbate metabolism protein UlaG (beta-lactamase superfamily)